MILNILTYEKPQNIFEKIRSLIGSQYIAIFQFYDPQIEREIGSCPGRIGILQ